MMMNSASFLQTLEAVALQAAAAEKTYRHEAAERIRVFERERSIAFRRLGLLQTMTAAVTGSESQELAIAGCLAILRAKLGWSSDTETRSATLARFASVPKAIFANLHPEVESAEPEVIAAMAAFESWYEEANPTPFWDLFDQAMPETPLVDF